MVVFLSHSVADFLIIDFNFTCSVHFKGSPGISGEPGTPGLKGDAGFPGRDGEPGFDGEAGEAVSAISFLIPAAFLSVDQKLCQCKITITNVCIYVCTKDQSQTGVYTNFITLLL